VEGGGDDVTPPAPDGGADVAGVAGGADVAGEVAGAAGVAGAGASCWQAVMITRLLAGSALPPTPLRSTK
jgi:hypothetical protein